MGSPKVRKKMLSLAFKKAENYLERKKMPIESPKAGRN